MSPLEPPRPIYVGVGTCDCQRTDVRMYHVPGTSIASRSVCGKCLQARGFEVPKPRTAEDIEVVDGKPVWRESQPTVPYSKEPLVHVGVLQLGHGHSFEAAIDKDGGLIGWLHTHPDARSEGALCQSFCAVRAGFGPEVHQVVCPDPLSLEPSLCCAACGSHGKVTDGKWEPC